MNSNPDKEGGNAMKCIACGREMVARETHYECSNVLCDYEEETEDREIWIRPKRDLSSIIVNDAVRIFSLHY